MFLDEKPIVTYIASVFESDKDETGTARLTSSFMNDVVTWINSDQAQFREQNSNEQS